MNTCVGNNKILDSKLYGSVSLNFTLSIHKVYNVKWSPYTHELCVPGKKHLFCGNEGVYGKITKKACLQEKYLH